MRRDIQLKGSGRTPFSRRGDGRAALGPVLREYIVSEAMAALGIPTTRALAAVITGEQVMRETRAARRGADPRRLQPHPRRHLPVFRGARRYGGRAALWPITSSPATIRSSRAPSSPYRALLEAVIGRQAALVARWLHIGFIHGVMNTDNTSISGETIDYGPCAFMDAYDPATVFSSIDEMGRYAYANQPRIALWNLTRLAECLLPLFAEEQEKAVEQAQAILGLFPEKFSAAYQAGLRQKIGLFTARDDDDALVQDLLNAMTDGKADFTLTFRRLSEAAAEPAADADVRALFAEPAAFNEWATRWRQRTAEEPQTPGERRAAMRAVNPAFIPRNHRIEAVIQAAVTADDYAPFEELLAVLAKPYEDQPAFAAYADPPEPHQRVLQTFCGT